MNSIRESMSHYYYIAMSDVSYAVKKCGVFSTKEMKFTVFGRKKMHMLADLFINEHWLVNLRFHSCLF